MLLLLTVRLPESEEEGDPLLPPYVSRLVALRHL